MSDHNSQFPGAHRVETVLGSPIGIDVRTALPQRELRPLLNDAFAWLRWVDETFSPLTYGGRVMAAPEPEVEEVLRRCAELREATHGHYDDSDPAGYVRGWAAERVSRALAAAGAVDHCVNAGGDVRVRGSSRPGVPWRIGIRDHRRVGARTVVLAHDLAVATSAITRLRTDQVVEIRPSAATVIGSDLALACAYAAALNRMNFARAKRFARDLALPRRPQNTPYDVLLLSGDGDEVTTPGFTAYEPEMLAV